MALRTTCQKTECRPLLGHDLEIISLSSAAVHHHTEGLVQNCSNSIANALKLLQSCTKPSCNFSKKGTNFWAQRRQVVQYIPRNMHTVFALLCFVVVIHWLIFPYPSGLLHWHCGNLTIAPVPAKQPWWIWINTSCEFIMNDCITTTKQSTTKPCAYFLGYTVNPQHQTMQGQPYNVRRFHCKTYFLWQFFISIRRMLKILCF